MGNEASRGDALGVAPEDDRQVLNAHLSMHNKKQATEEAP